MNGVPPKSNVVIVDWFTADLAYQIVCRHKELHDFVDEQGNLPLHLLANAPSAFVSGSRLGFLSNIIYGRKYIFITCQTGSR